jgi:AcrR family transcriptional regulator
VVAKKIDRRTQIKTTAAKLFAERGYHGTTMDDLALKLGLNKATVYYHYSRKNELLSAIYNEPANKLLRLVGEIPPQESPVKSLAALIRFLLRMLEQDPHEIAVYCQEMRWLEQWLPPRVCHQVRAKQDEFTRYVVGLVGRGIAEGTFRDVDAQVARSGSSVRFRGHANGSSPAEHSPPIRSRIS